MSIQQLAEQAPSLDLRDLTGDGVPELAVSQYMSLVVIGCKNGQFEIILDYVDSSSWVGGPSIYLVEDMNLNGVPEVVTQNTQTTGGNTAVQIFEWNGVELVSLIKGDHGSNSQKTSRIARTLYWYERYWIGASSYTDFPEEILEITSPAMNGGASISISDIDGNGSKELILADSGPGHWDTVYNFGPWRGKEVIFQWDGLHFLYSALEMDPPEYRYQAVQDADRHFLMGEYEKALELYQQVIFDNELEWWSPERMDFIAEEAFYYSESGDPTPVAPPIDLNEYENLAAYARYRIVLHYLAGGFLPDAQIVYDTLLEKFPSESVGYRYAEMATLLMSSYRDPASLAAACAQVVDYVRDYPEVLDLLGSSDHGLQDHNYEHIDVCPFADPFLSPPL